MVLALLKTPAQYDAQQLKMAMKVEEKSEKTKIKTKDLFTLDE